MSAKIKYFWELEVYKKAFKAAMTIFELTKRFPKHERYALTDQIRRSSRSATGNIAEAWHKRRYEAAFVSKLNDAEAEAAETQNWLFYARTCDYLTEEEKEALKQEYDHIIGKVVKMMNNPKDWLLARQPE